MMPHQTTKDPAAPVGGIAFFGSEVRHAREHAGMTQAQLALAAAYDRTYVSRVENGSLLGSEQFAESCDRVFATSGYFTRLATRIREHGHPDWFRPYVALEKEASAISDYSTIFLMGAVQTPEYAEAVFRASRPYEGNEAIKTRVDARMARREVTQRQSPPQFWLIVHEAALQVPVGGAKVMAAQLDYVLERAVEPHITVQVLPFRAGAPTTDMPFTMLSPTASDEGPVLYSETTGTGHVNDSQEAVRRWAGRFDHMRASAASEADSLRLIHKIRREHECTDG
ncbi:helix-turn-helix domain-containing protein [Streptomyces zagrosensis]|uniref:Transcriptional regulator with XRE-family HTH domain n=1 Tax=Streptomyces zagrosensis TaxID=1042984 RepID=A0A7W9QE12_9ACTN|nr:helix-turn-helix transcriptional regulator [Streptomyces zagrosensis]MBB5938214.1 transcriptional regulator with XRE-family HTH domain [Streptomyces zagrosensis]